MNKESGYSKYLYWFIFVALLISLVGCGKRDKVKIDDKAATDNSEFDALFNDQKKEADKPGDDEGEVLKLLGITPTEKSKPVETVETPPVEPTVEPVNSEELKKLEDELNSKNTENRRLLDELDQERQKNYELQTQLDSERNKPKTSSTPAPSGFRARYDEALEKYHSRNYRAAIDLFDQLLVNNPGNSLADNCQYWIGECHYALGDYTKAIAAFEKVFSFNNSNKNDDAQLKLGMCYWRLNDVSRAKEEFERLISHYPDSEYTPLARKYINRM